MSSRLQRKRQEKKRDWQGRRKRKNGENRGSMRIGLRGMRERGMQSGIATVIATKNGVLKEKGLVKGVEEGAGMQEEDRNGGKGITGMRGRGRRGIATERADPVLLSGIGIGGYQEAQFDHTNKCVRVTRLQSFDDIIPSSC